MGHWCESLLWYEVACHCNRWASQPKSPKSSRYRLHASGHFKNLSLDGWTITTTTTSKLLSQRKKDCKRRRWLPPFSRVDTSSECRWWCSLNHSASSTMSDRIVMGGFGSKLKSFGSFCPVGTSLIYGCFSPSLLSLFLAIFDVENAWLKDEGSTEKTKKHF